MAGHWIIIIVSCMVILSYKKLRQMCVLNVKLRLVGILEKLLLVVQFIILIIIIIYKNGGGENAQEILSDVLCGGLIPFYILNSITRCLQDLISLLGMQ